MLCIHDEIMCPNCMHAKLLCNELNKLSWQWEVIFALSKRWNNHFWNSKIQNIYRRLMWHLGNKVLQSWHIVAKQIPSGQAAKLVVTSRNWTPLSFGFADALLLGGGAGNFTRFTPLQDSFKERPLWPLRHMIRVMTWPLQPTFVTFS